MKRLWLSLIFVLFGLIGSFLCGAGVVAIAQANSLTIGSFTIDATGTPTLTVKPPTRAGTLAVTADIPAAQPGTNAIAGAATLNGGSVTVTFTALTAAPPICVAIDTTAASPVRRSAVTATSVTFEGVSNHQIEYICTAKNN